MRIYHGDDAAHAAHAVGRAVDRLDLGQRLLTEFVGQTGKGALQASAAIARSLTSVLVNWRRL